MSFLIVDNLSVIYREIVAIQHLNLSVEEGSIYSLIGPSGCGKSTFLKTICGIIKPTEGNVLLKEEVINPRKQTLGYIPQHYGLLDWLTVENNLFLGKKIQKKKATHEAKIIEQLDIGNLLKRYPKELSGGQQQRVALARAWMLQPDLLLMDEPFSSLDTYTAEKSRELFLQLWKEQRTTTLFVTHNLQEAVRTGKYIVLFSRQPARILEIIENPLFQSGMKREDVDFYRVEQSIRKRIQEIGEGGL